MTTNGGPEDAMEISCGYFDRDAYVSPVAPDGTKHRLDDAGEAAPTVDGQSIGAVHSMDLNV